MSSIASLAKRSVNSGMWFFGIVGGFAAGIAARSLFDFGLSLLIFLGILGALFIVLSLVKKEAAILLLVGFIFISAGFGVVRFEFAERGGGAGVLEGVVGQEVTLEGVVVKEPVEKDNSQQIVLEVIEGWQSTRVLLIASRFPEVFYGDRVVAGGELTAPESFETDTGRVFDYPKYLAKDNIFYQMFYPEIEVVGHGEGNVIKENLFALKSAFLDRIERVMPEPHAALLAGLLAGVQESLGDDLLDDFRVVGLIHIIVLSGYNVTIVAEAIMRFFGFLRRGVRFSLGALAITMFAVLVGGTATVVRASLMALLVIVARATGRTYDITRALFLAGFIMLLVNPKLLLFDPSFQLSFLATLGLLYVAPLLEQRLFRWVPTRWGIREFVTATIATQVFVLPILLTTIGQISLVSVPVNVLILPLVPLIMLIGFIAGVVGFVSTVLAFPFAALTTGLLAYVLGVVRGAAAIPFASVVVPSFPVLLMVVLYAVYIVVLTVVHKRTPTPAAAGAGVLEE